MGLTKREGVIINVYLNNNINNNVFDNINVNIDDINAIFCPLEPLIIYYKSIYHKNLAIN